MDSLFDYETSANIISSTKSRKRNKSNLKRVRKKTYIRVRKNEVNKSKCKDNSKKRKIGFCAYQDGEEKMEEEKLFPLRVVF